MTSTYTNYRAWLKDEFSARSSRNGLYSLRAFARDISLKPSHLSDVLKGRLGLSAKSASKIAKAVGMTETEGNYFVTLVESEHSRNLQRRNQAKEKVSHLTQTDTYHELDDEIFEIISDWHHYAILELVLTQDFVPKLTWIADRLGIKREVVKEAVLRLKKVGLLKIENGQWLVQEKFPATRSGIPSAAIRSFHSQILRKALDAIHTQSVEKRDFSSITMAINQEDLPEIKEELKVFRRQLEKKYKARANKRSVYSLNIQLFSLCGGDRD